MGKSGAFPETLLSHRQAQNLVMPKILDFFTLKHFHAGSQVKLLDYLNKLREEEEDEEEEEGDKDQDEKEEKEEANEEEEVNPVNLSDPCRLHGVGRNGLEFWTNEMGPRNLCPNTLKHRRPSNSIV